MNSGQEIVQKYRIIYPSSEGFEDMELSHLNSLTYPSTYLMDRTYINILITVSKFRIDVLIKLFNLCKYVVINFFSLFSNYLPTENNLWNFFECKLIKRNIINRDLRVRKKTINKLSNLVAKKGFIFLFFFIIIF